jgi:hypothetical protein
VRCTANCASTERKKYGHRMVVYGLCALSPGSGLANDRNRKHMDTTMPIMVACTTSGGTRAVSEML